MFYIGPSTEDIPPHVCPRVCRVEQGHSAPNRLTVSVQPYLSNNFLGKHSPVMTRGPLPIRPTTAPKK